MRIELDDENTARFSPMAQKMNMSVGAFVNEIVKKIEVIESQTTIVMKKGARFQSGDREIRPRPRTTFINRW